MAAVLDSKDLFGVFMVKEINEEKINIRSDQFNNKDLNGVIVFQNQYVDQRIITFNKSLKENSIFYKDKGKRVLSDRVNMQRQKAFKRNQIKPQVYFQGLIFYKDEFFTVQKKTF